MAYSLAQSAPSIVDDSGRFVIKDTDYDASHNGTQSMSMQNRTSYSEDQSVDTTRTDNDASVSLDSSRPSNCDFLSVLTSISAAYQDSLSREYIDMPALNGAPMIALAGGKDFEVSSYTFNVAALTPNKLHSDDNISRLIVKRMKRPSRKVRMNKQEMSLFVRELDMLHHLHGHRNIVKLKGAGWFYDPFDSEGHSPVLEPSILLEEAKWTLAHLLHKSRRLSFTGEMCICKDVASGLQALHTCGIVHGDVKPNNVLVFPLGANSNGIEDWRYVCKISDFSLARAPPHQTCWFDWGTPRYMAPERYSLVSAANLPLTDVWSLGILFAAVTERGLDFSVEVGDAITFGSRIMAQVQARMLASTWTSPMVQVRETIFAKTLQQRPHRRCLSTVVSSLDSFFASTYQAATHIHPKPSTFSYTHENELEISYESFKHVGGQVKDAIVEALQVSGTNHNDARRPRALYELAVITLSGFTNPYASIHAGTTYLRQAAACGDLRAQAYSHRVLSAFCSEQVSKSGTVLQWLELAASEGHSVAAADLRRLDGNRANRALVHYANVSSTQIFPQGVSGNDTHRMAATGDLSGLKLVATTNPACLDVRDMYKNVPLITAGRYRQYEVVVFLLQAGACPSHTNSSGENFLHHVWCFTKAQLKHIFSMIPNIGNLLVQEAAHKQGLGSFEVLSTWLGTPMERAVMMNRLEAVSAFLTVSIGHIVPNGLVLRRALLLAFRLHHTHVQELLISFAHQMQKLRANTLVPLYLTYWEYKGHRMSYLDAIVIGNISHLEPGVDQPWKWWSICQDGAEHGIAFRDSVEIFIAMVPDKMRDYFVDNAIGLAFHERWSDPLAMLIDCKASITNGIDNRLKSLRPLLWYTNTRPGLWKSERRFEIIREDDVTQRHDYLKGLRVLEKPALEVNFIDQIFRHENVGTMLHQALWKGDRKTFAMLKDLYGADPTLPSTNIHVASPGNAPILWQANCYSLLAESRHFDLWFANQLRQAKLQFNYPYYEVFEPLEMPHSPLLLALLDKRFGYAIWMMKHGAHLDDQVTPGHTVIKSVFESERFDIDHLRFFFPLDRKSDGHPFLPNELRDTDGFNVFNFLYSTHPDKSYLRIRLHGEDIFNRALVEDDVDVWHYTQRTGGIVELNAMDLCCQEFHTSDNLGIFGVILFVILLAANWTAPGWFNPPTEATILCRPEPASKESRSNTREVPEQQRLKALKSYLQHLFEVYPGVSNSSSTPKGKDKSKPVSLLEQSIRRGYGSSMLFAMTVQHYHDRAENDPDKYVFPRQTWRDLLRSSPLDNIRSFYWKRTVLYTRYKYSPSLRDPLLRLSWFSLLLFLDIQFVLYSVFKIGIHERYLSPIDVYDLRNNLYYLIADYGTRVIGILLFVPLCLGFLFHLFLVLTCAF